MAHRTAVILVVGLTRGLIGPWSPRLGEFVDRGVARTLDPVLPAVTCTVQSSMLTGLAPGSGGGGGCTSAGGHGVVANGWYNRELAEVQFWKQSNRLVHGEKVWEAARRRDPSVTCANLFWWFNMYSSVDISVTPRPIYTADGRKVPDVYTRPAELRGRLQGELGRFPLFRFWGPGADIASTRWIADAAILTDRWRSPTLSLVYLPHLDYDFQRFGPDDPRARAAVAELDPVVGGLIDHYRERGVRVVVLSEYAIERATRAVAINRALREAGLLAVREELGHELLDAGASRAFAVADHQVAHVYVDDPGDVASVQRLCAGVPGVGSVLTRDEQRGVGVDHPRSGELVAVAAPGCWFCYDYWLDDGAAPDFARTVDIHRKPGYDPRELFVDPALFAPKLRIAWTLFRKKLGQRTLMEVVPLDHTVVRGTHGRLPSTGDDAPLLVVERDRADRAGRVPCTAVRDVILEHLFVDD